MGQGNRKTRTGFRQFDIQYIVVPDMMGSHGQSKKGIFSDNDGYVCMTYVYKNRICLRIFPRFFLYRNVSLNCLNQAGKHLNFYL